MVFKTGAFQLSPDMTPDQVANKRAMIAALLPKFGSARFVGEGIGQLATGVMAGRQGRKLDEIEGKGTASANSLWERLMGTANSAQSPDMGPLTVLGMKPEGPAMPPPDPTSPHALGDDAMAALGKPAMKTAADPASIKAGLVARGLPEHVAEGFVMNFQDESGLNPGINEAAPTVPGSRGGFGLYQLTGPRRRAYEAYAAERGVPLDDVDAQLDFMMMELQGPEAAAWSKISGTQNAGEAGAAIVNSFLRPAEEHRASRAAEYLGGGGGTTAAPAPTSAPTIPINELYMALQNPWLSGEQKGLITSMIQEQQQASDPLRQLELQKAQLELERMQAPAAPPEEMTTRMLLAKEAGLEQGTPEYQTYLLTGELPEPAEPGYRTMTAEEAKQLGLPPGAYQMGPKGEIKAIGGGGVNVSVDTGGGSPDLGKLSTDYGYLTNPDGSIKRDPVTGLAISAPVPGSPAATEAAALAAKGGKADSNKAIATDVVTTAAAAARAADKQRIVGGVFGQMASMNPSSPNAEVYRQVDVLKSNASVENLTAMRAASPTGGALGAVSDKENAMLSAKSGALDPASPNFARDLDDYERTLLRIVHGQEAGDRIFEETREKPSSSDAPDADGWTTLPNGVKVRVKQ